MPLHDEYKGDYKKPKPEPEPVEPVEEIQVVKDIVKVNQVIGETSTQSMVEGTATVPDDKPNIEQVISVDANLNTAELDIEVIEGKVIIEGQIDVKVMYVADDVLTQPVHFFETTIDFSTFIKVEGAKPKMAVSINVDIEYVQFNVRNSRMADIRIVLELFAKVTKPVRIEIVTDVLGKDCQVLREAIKVDDVIGEEFSQTIVKSDVELPPDKPDIEEIIKTDVSVEEKDVKVIEDKVIVEGTLTVKILYVAEVSPELPQQPVHFFEAEVDFTHFVHIDGARPDMNAIVKFLVEAARGRRRNARTVAVEAILELFVKVTDVMELDLMVDCYCPGIELDIVKDLFKLPQVIGEDTTQTVVKQTLEVPQEKPDIEQIYNVKASASVDEKRIIDGKAIIEGTVDVETLYVADVDETEPQQPLHFTEGEIPFTVFVDIPGAKPGMPLEVIVMIEHVSYSVIDPRQYEVRVVIAVFAKVTKVVEIEIVIDVIQEDVVEEIVDPEKPDEKEHKPSMRIYIVQRGDTLWKIAKRYDTTVDAIVQANSIQNPDSIMPGQKLVIP